MAKNPTPDPADLSSLPLFAPPQLQRPASAAASHLLRATTRTEQHAPAEPSATSIDPRDHSPFNANPTADLAAMNTAKLGDSATTGISSENIRMFSASSVRRP